jgi:hypothetical protein
VYIAAAIPTAVLRYNDVTFQLAFADKAKIVRKFFICIL